MITVTHRRYVPYSHAHYAGNLVDGAYALGLFGDAATEVCIRTDGDEGLFASYSDVQFRSPIRAGDVVEVTATVTRVGGRSRTIDFTCRVVCRGRFAPAVASAQPPAGFIEPSAGSARPSADGGSAAEVLDPPIVAVTATGTVVVPPRR
jgi:3-aminobutyryl-CoA ammonia-lyase